MRVLFDHNVPHKMRRHLEGHEVFTAEEMGWAELEMESCFARPKMKAFSYGDLRSEHLLPAEYGGTNVGVGGS